MTIPADRRIALRQLAAEGDETAAHDLFAEFGEVAGTEPDNRPPAHAPHLCLCRMGLKCPNKDSCSCVAGRSQCNGTASNRKGT
jgi:hypothetical protein